MRVESCGPLFAEPKQRDLFFSNHHRLSEPITIINPKNNNNFQLVGENEDDILKLDTPDRVAESDDTKTVIAGQRGAGLVPAQHPVGFFLTEEEWSLYRQQPEFAGGVEEPEKKMTQPLSPFESYSQSSHNASMLSCHRAEPNNNNKTTSDEIHSSSLFSNAASTTPLQQQKEEEVQEKSIFVRPLSLSSNENYYINSPDTSTSSALQHHTPSAFVKVHSNNQQCNPNNNNNNNSSATAVSWNIDGSSTISSSFLQGKIPLVGTIGSHPQPITSISTAHGHVHHSSIVSSPPPSHPQNSFGQTQPSSFHHDNYNWVDDEYEQECTQDYFEDWQSQSIFLSSEVDKAKLKWNQTQNNNNNNNMTDNEFGAVGGEQFIHQSQQQQQQQPWSSHLQKAGVGGRTEDMNTLITFLSKFDDKVAAIWGGQQYENSGGFGGGTYPIIGGAGFPYSESYLSSCSTPISCNMYPWAASPTGEQQIHYYQHQHRGPLLHYDLRTIQNQIEQQQQQLCYQQLQQEQQQYANSFYGMQQLLQQQQQQTFINSNYDSVQKPCASQHYALVAVDPSVIMPPRTPANPLMHAIKEHFGLLAMDGEYHIVKTMNVESSVEEKENSLNQLNHNDEGSGFKRFIPQLKGQQQEEKEEAVPIVDIIETSKNVPVVDVASSELEISCVQEIFSSLDLEGEGQKEEEEYDETLDEDYDPEVAAIFRLNPRTFYEQQFVPLELFKSWNTHFTPVNAIEKRHNSNNDSSKTSAQGILPPRHENNPNLPEYYYTLFSGVEKEYSVFLHPAKTMFPIRFKICPQPEKSIQTDRPPIFEEKQSFHTHSSFFDWGSFEYSNGNNNDHPSISSGSRTPLDFGPSVMDNNNNNSWFLDDVTSTGFGDGLDYEYGINNNRNPLLFGFVQQHQQQHQHTFVPTAQSDYCCDSGIGIDGSSRSGFYDDLYPAEYEEAGGGFNYLGNGEGVVLQPFSTNNDDYGQFQSWSTTSGVSKVGKNSRRRNNNKGKPCKYFLTEGSCKRGLNCKFSHDLTTCRYWAEGSCLKGDLCPYLHCFIDGNIDYGEPKKEKRRAGKRYHLESENDFPTLGAFGNSMNTLSSRENLVITTGYEVDEAAGSSMIGQQGHNLLMLADPAGSIFESYGFGVVQSSEFDEFPSIQQEQQQTDALVPQPLPLPFNNELLKRNNAGRSTGTGKQRDKLQHGSSWPRHATKGTTNNNNNNWISSMISVKEKRKKKKQ